MDFFDIQQWIYILRMVIAGGCGFLIGLERKNRAKEAGIRTHCVVACASALMMVISKYGFADMTIGELGVRGADGARIAAQVVSGVGFLGAGMIFVHKNTITGLTTAAGIWATAGVGLAIGAGMYVVGVAATLFIIFVQILLHQNFKWLRKTKQKVLRIRGVHEPDFQKKTTRILREMGVHVTDVTVEKDENGCRYELTVEMAHDVCEENVVRLFDSGCKISNT